MNPSIRDHVTNATCEQMHVNHGGPTLSAPPERGSDLPPANPDQTVAALLNVRPETINRHIREIRQLLQQAGHTIQPSPHLLATLDDLYNLATAEGISVPSDVKTAC